MSNNQRCLTLLGSALSAQDEVKLDRQIMWALPTAREFIRLPGLAQKEVATSQCVDPQHVIKSFVEQVEAVKLDSTDDGVDSAQPQTFGKRGRKAIGLGAFRTIAEDQIVKLQARMAKLGDQRSKEWQNLRKQVLMYKLRVKQRRQALAAKNQISNQKKLVEALLEQVACEVKPSVFQAIMRDLQESFSEPSQQLAQPVEDPKMFTNLLDNYRIPQFQ